LLDYDLSRVDLSSFPSITARIDRLDIAASPSDLSGGGLDRLRAGLGRTKQGHQRVTSSMQIAGAQRLYFVVHDLTGRQLSYLVRNFYDRQVLRIEVAIDFKLAPSENDLRKLWLLKAQLRHCLQPQGFSRLQGAKRKFYRGAYVDGDKGPRGRYVADGLGTPSPLTQVIWENQHTSPDVLALYVKTTDRGQPLLGQPFVRLELRMVDAGPHLLGMGRLGLFPVAADKLRRALAPSFHVCAGFSGYKPAGRGFAGDAWARWGAQWANSRSLSLQPETAVNARIGMALENLRKTFMKLPRPQPSARTYEDWLSEFGP
jgi:hypothetical protein